MYQSLNNFLRTIGMMNLCPELRRKRKDSHGTSLSVISKNYTRTYNEEDFILIYLQNEFLVALLAFLVANPILFSGNKYF